MEKNNKDKSNDKITIVDVIALGIVACMYLIGYCTGFIGR